MNKVNGAITSFAPIREEGSRITICYGLKELTEQLYEWYEVYLPKKQLSQLTIQTVKDAVIGDINARVKEQIISGFVYDGSPVWLSEENQMNFTQAIVPVTLKIGEQKDGTPVYRAFENKTSLKSFCEACIQWKQQCLADGWREKDSIDWQQYELMGGKE